MNRLTTLALIATSLLLQACATSAPITDHQSPDGDWRTKIQTKGGVWLSHGIMTFSGQEKATYAYHNGRIYFESVNDQGLWKGYWVEDTWGPVQCSEKRDGSKTWGEAIFQFDDTFNSYEGTWDACGDGRKSAWVGKRS